MIPVAARGFYGFSPSIAESYISTCCVILLRGVAPVGASGERSILGWSATRGRQKDLGRDVYAAYTRLLKRHSRARARALHVIERVR